MRAGLKETKAFWEGPPCRQHLSLRWCRQRRPSEAQDGGGVVSCPLRSKITHTCMRAAITPAKQPRTEGTASNEKKQKQQEQETNRKGWEAQGALRELRELSTARGATVQPQPWSGSSIRGFDLPARSPQQVHSYNCPEPRASQRKEQEQVGACTPTGRPSPERLFPEAAARHRERMLSSKRIPRTTRIRACTAVTYPPDHFRYDKPQRRCREDRKATSALGDCRSFLGSEAPVGATVSVPLHLHQVGGGSSRVPWPTCKVGKVCFLDIWPSPFHMN